MGMYTTILDPGKNLSVQIKCGEDTCDTFSVGDTVPWHIIEDWPQQGYLFDDVYLGMGGTPDQDEDYSWDDYWVVIKNHVVLEVFPYQESDGYPELREQYQIQDPPKDLWSEEAWGKHHAMVADLKKKGEKFEAAIAHLPQVERCAKRLHRAFGRRLNYGAIAKSFINVQPMPDGALSLYDEDPELDPTDY